MRRRAHTRIAAELSRKMRLSKEHEKILLDAILEPDRWRSRNFRVSHHYLQYDIILSHLKMARKAYLENNMPSCLYHLGIALHFLQDALIPSPREFRQAHDRIEARTEDPNLLHEAGLREAIDVGFKTSFPSPKFIERALLKVKWTYDEQHIIWKAAVLSASIAAAVFGSRNPPDGLEEEYRELKKRHNRRILAASLTSLLSAAGGSFLILQFSEFSILLFLLFFLFMPLVIFHKFVGSDFEFYDIEEEAEWYGIA